MNRNLFIKTIVGESFEPMYETIQSIKLFSETLEDGYKSIYISEYENQLMLSLVEKTSKDTKEKLVFSYPAEIRGDYIYLEDNDFEEEEFKYLKKYEDILYINPIILGLIKDGMFKYIPKEAIVKGGEPSLTEESIKDSLNIPKGVHLNSTILYEYAVVKDYITTINMKKRHNYMYKKSNSALLSIYNYCAYGCGQPNINIRHSVVHPYKFTENNYGDKIIRGEFSSKNDKKFFLIKPKGNDILIKYPENKIDSSNALHFATGKANNSVYNFVIKTYDNYIAEKVCGE